MNQEEVKYIDVNKDTVNIFLSGIKPALAIPKDELCLIEDFKNYPLVEFTSIVMLFQNESQKESFLLAGGTGPALVGKYLGFPPKAIESFISKPPMEERVRVIFHGIIFVTTKSYLADDLEWLYRTYDIPESLMSGFHLEFYSLNATSE